MVELLFRDVEACVATARRMEMSGVWRKEWREVGTQATSPLLDFLLGMLLLRDCVWLEEQEGEDEWRESDPTTTSIPWRGLRLILTEQLRMQQDHAAAAAISESKRRTLALAQRCCAPSAAERPTAAEAAAELDTVQLLSSYGQLDTITRLADTAGVRAPSYSMRRQLSTDSDTSSSGSDPWLDTDVPPPEQAAPPLFDSHTCTGSPRLQRTLSAQSARDWEVRARSDAERLLDAERAYASNLTVCLLPSSLLGMTCVSRFARGLSNRLLVITEREQEELDRSIESVR